MSTARDLIASSLRLIGAIASGETPNASEQADALVVLNDMLGSWSTENLIIYATVREELNLISGQSAYTIGADPSADFNTERPLELQSVGLKLINTSPSAELPIDVINDRQYADLIVKDIQSSIPTMLYPEGSFPLDKYNLWPVPSVNHILVLYSRKPLATIASPNTVINFPPGYAKALRFGLAVELAPEYGKEASPSVINGAMESKANIKRQNIKPEYMGCDSALMGNSRKFNIFSGDA